MMTFDFLFILIFISICNGLSLPSQLKCADKACHDNVSVGRTLQHTKLLFGDLKEIKKSTKVNIKGKNVDMNNSLWLIEYDGLMGFIDFSLLKENIYSVVNDLEVVNNPYYHISTDNIIDDTKASDDDDDHKLFHNQDVAANSNSGFEIHKTETLPPNNVDANNILNETNLKVTDDTLIEDALPIAKDEKSSKDNKDITTQKDADTVKMETENNSKENDNARIEKESEEPEDEKKAKENIKNNKEVIKDEQLEEVSKHPNEKENTTMESSSVSIRENNTKVNSNDDSNETESREEITEETKDNFSKDKKSQQIEPENADSIDNKQTKDDLTKFHDEPSKKVIRFSPVDKSDENKADSTEIEPKKGETLDDVPQAKDEKVKQEINETTGDTTVKEEEQTLGNGITKEGKEMVNKATDEDSSLTNVSEGVNVEEITTESTKSESTKNDTASVNEEKPHDDESLKDRQKEMLRNIFPPNEQRKDLSKTDTQKIASEHKNSIPNTETNTDDIQNRANVDDENIGSKDGSENVTHSTDNSEVHQTVTEAVEDSDHAVTTKSDPWLSMNDRATLDSAEERIRSIKSPLLFILLKIEKWMQSSVQALIQRTRLSSSIYLTKFVHNWLCLSLENVVLILLLFVSVIIVVYTPKMFRLRRDWRYECESQSQLIAELETKLRTMEEVRHKLTIQNYNFERVVDEYKGRVTDIQEDAAQNTKNILSDLEKMKKSNEKKIAKLSQELDVKMQQYNLLEKDYVGKEAIIEEIREDLRAKEDLFAEELSAKEDTINELQKKLLETEELKEALRKVAVENTESKEEIVVLSATLRDRSEELNKLNSAFERMKLFEELGEEECREKVQKCLQYNVVRQQLDEVEVESGRLRGSLEAAIGRINELEVANGRLEQLTAQYKEQQTLAAKEQQAAELKLTVLTDYFHRKEIEMQKSLGHESIEKSQFLDKAESYRHKIETLESENASLSKTVDKLKAEIKQCQMFAADCKNEANTQVSNAIMSMAHMERELTREKEEGKQLRAKLSYYVGPTPPRYVAPNNSKDRPQSRQSLTSDTGNSIPPPPIFPLSLLPQTNQQRSPYSGRNSVNSISKRSNNS